MGTAVPSVPHVDYALDDLRGGSGLAPDMDMDEGEDEDEGPGLPPVRKTPVADAPRSRPAKPKRPVNKKADVEDKYEDVMVDDEDELGPSVGGVVTDELEFSDDSRLSSVVLPGYLSESMDLVTVAGLLQWTSSALRKLGKEHLVFLLDLSERTGRVPEHTRKVLEAVIPLFEVNSTQAPALSVKQIVSMMAQLDGFLGNVSPADSRLLPFLLQDDLEVFPLIRP